MFDRFDTLFWCESNLVMFTPDVRGHLYRAIKKIGWLVGWFYHTAKKACVCLYVSNQGTSSFNSSQRDWIMKINAFSKGTCIFNPGPSSYESAALPLSHRTSLSHCTIVKRSHSKYIFTNVHAFQKDTVHTCFLPLLLEPSLHEQPVGK